MAKKVQRAEEEPLLSTQAAADMIGIHIRTLYRYLARGVVREPTLPLQGAQDSIYRGRLRQWNTGEIELARVAIETYHRRARGGSQGKTRHISRHHRHTATRTELLTTKEVLDILKITQQTLNFICSTRAEKKWGKTARLRVAARNRYASRLFNPQDVRKWFEYMMERSEKYKDLGTLQQLDGTPLFASSHHRFDLAFLSREILDHRKRRWTGTQAPH